MRSVPEVNRREFLGVSSMLWARPGGAVAEPHFPSRLHQFVWRNWELANADRMARVVRTSSAKILALGHSMGLPKKPTLSQDQLRRIYITVIRQNWRLLPEQQIVELLGWDRARLDFALKEDDFLGVKLGVKPQCEELAYRPPTRAERQHAARIRAIVRRTLGGALNEKGEPLCDFVRQLSERVGGPPPQPERRKPVWHPRYLYSYLALYGDPLMEPEADPFPDGYLEKLARVGIDAVWMQGVLRTLAPSRSFPEFGAGSETRLANLNALVERARRFGIKVYLYLNEPRAMPESFFEKRPGLRGSAHLGLYAMCTSTPAVREWIGESLAHIVERVPDLGGFFTITMSENHTNCFSHRGAWAARALPAEDCPRCSKRTAWDAIGELIQTFRDGIRRSSATADLIVWDWGWSEELSANLIPWLPRDVRFLSLSEWDQPVHRGGVDTKVGEYSMSVVGPGPRALRNWKRARERGLATMAKVAFNNTWEMSAVPYIPVPNLVLEHCERLSNTGISGIMASWTLGGYPSPNLEAAKAYYFEPHATREAILESVARERYGEAAAAAMVAGWTRFSEAFQEFPYGVAIYIIPVQHGPANLLRVHPTGERPGMILFPQDDVKAWCGRYPPEVVQKQFAGMAQQWQHGLAAFRAGLRNVPGAKRADAELDLAIAETCYHHFQSVANQVEFCLLRGRGDAGRVRSIVEHEIELAARQYRIARRHSSIAYEASNHYYYTPLDLVEKILNCRQILEGLGAGR